VSAVVTAEFVELIDPRPGEEVEPSRLEPYLRAHLPASEGAFALRQFGGGHANLTYLVRFGAHEYVLRRPPLGPVAPASHDMKREHRVLAAMPDIFPLAPRSYLYCDDKTIIGAEFHVMERRRGIVIRGDLPERFRDDKAVARRIGEMMIDVLGALHKADPEAAGLGQLGHPEGYAGRQLEGWAKRWQAAKDKELPRVDALIAWLAARLPPPPAVSLLHNDFKLDNMLVAAEDPGRPVAVLDWDMCTRGDPLMDLGYLLNLWAQGDDDPEWLQWGAMPTWRQGSPSRVEAIERYGKVTGFPLDHIDWYHVYGLFKMIVIIQQIYIRYLRGQTLDQRFAIFGGRVAAFAEKGHMLIAQSGKP
jgi:aminoglycoside phosphotransferase (APT) family kinase protein